MHSWPEGGRATTPGHAIENIPASWVQVQDGPSTTTSLPKPELLVPKISGSASVSNHQSSSAVSTRSENDVDEEGIPSATSVSVTSSDEISKPSYDKVLPLSPGQSRFWFQKDLLDDQTTANNTICVPVTGDLRVDSLERAVRTVTARHEALRTSFFIDGDKPVQAISDTSRLCLEQVALTSESQVTQEFEKVKKHTYDIEHGETERYLLIGSHHIVIDGVSLEVFLNDLQRAYNRQPLSGPAYQYSTYTETLLRDLSAGKLKDDVTYWEQEFEAVPAPLPLIPFLSARSCTTLNSYGSVSVTRMIDASLAKVISDACRKLNANVFHFHLGVLQVLLYKLFNTNDICIGMADANRLDKQVASSIGMILGTLYGGKIIKGGIVMYAEQWLEFLPEPPTAAIPLERPADV
ncbi:Condensation domain containing protein [Hyaloscypha variabilis]